MNSMGAVIPPVSNWHEEPPSKEPFEALSVTHKGKLIADATTCPQDIAYPTDLNLLNDTREKSEAQIDAPFDAHRYGFKPQTYRKVAWKVYLRTAQKKVKSKKEIRNALRKQMNYLNRNLKSIDVLLDAYDSIPLDCNQHKYRLVIHTLYDQQRAMFEERTHSIDHRIVSVHQPHVRPIVGGKTNANDKFEAKIQVSLMNGYALLDDLSWKAFNEGARLMSSVEKYKARFGYYPEEVLVVKIYCNHSNRTVLKVLGVKLRAKPLGRPKAVGVEYIKPGERNPKEGKLGQTKTA